MNFPEFHKRIIQASGQSLRRIALLNPLTIHRKGTRVKAIFALALVCFFWGTTWIAAKEAVRNDRIHPLYMSAIRQLLGGLCFLFFFISKGQRWPKGKEWNIILVLSFLNFILSNGLSTWGLKYISSGLGSIMGAIFPLWLVIIGLFTAKNRMPAKAIIGLVLGFGGVCIIFYEHFHSFADPAFQKGIILSIIATWSWAFGTLYTKKNAASFNPYFSLGLQMVISSMALFLGSIFTGIATPLVSIPWQSWASIGYLVIFGSVISFISYLYALQRLPTEQVSVYAYINPMVAVLLGWMIFSEELTVFIAVGGLVALFGVFMVNKAFRSLPPREQPETEGM
ncbi:MAG: EamA family transporter [Chitinophagaceae bacterium]|nr:EamA family transporter [Chitinophagaceae bacterium]